MCPGKVCVWWGCWFWRAMVIFFYTPYLCFLLELVKGRNKWRVKKENVLMSSERNP